MPFQRDFTRPNPLIASLCKPSPPGWPKPSQALCLLTKASFLAHWFYLLPSIQSHAKPPSVFGQIEVSCIWALALPFTYAKLYKGKLSSINWKLHDGMIRTASRHFQFGIIQHGQRSRIRFCGTTTTTTRGHEATTAGLTRTERERKRCKTGNMRRSKWLDWPSCASYKFRPAICSNTENKFSDQNNLEATREGWLVTSYGHTESRDTITEVL